MVAPEAALWVTTARFGPGNVSNIEGGTMIRSVITASALASLALLAACDQSPPPLTEEQKLVGWAEKEVRDRLNDPTSAQFEDVSASIPDKCVTGKVLAKNGFGAFNGYHEFVWRPHDVRFQPERGNATALISFVDARLDCRRILDHSLNSEARVKM